MEAQQLEVQCPICNQPIDGEMKSHLFAHSKMEVIDELIAYIESADQSGEAD